MLKLSPTVKTTKKDSVSLMTSTSCALNKPHIMNTSASSCRHNLGVLPTVDFHHIMKSQCAMQAVMCTNEDQRKYIDRPDQIRMESSTTLQPRNVFIGLFTPIIVLDKIYTYIYMYIQQHNQRQYI